MSTKYALYTACLCVMITASQGCLIEEVSERKPPSDSTDMGTGSGQDAGMGGLTDMNRADLGMNCPEGRQDNDGDGQCELTCAVNSCTTREQCDDSSGIATCVCQDEFTGSDCQSCAEGYLKASVLNAPLICLKTESCMDLTDPCMNGGMCVLLTAKAGQSNRIECLGCDEGYAGFEHGPGNRCTECIQGYVKDLNEECVPQVDALCVPDCEGGKSCQLDAQMNSVCVCAEGQQDDNGDGLCNPTCATQFPMDECDGRGQCVISRADGATGGKPACVCDEGYASMGSALDCQTCASTHRRVDDECVLRDECQANSCSGGGDCTDDTGVIVCTCFGAYDGALCETCAQGYRRDGQDNCVEDLCVAVTCQSNATCEVETGDCLCDAGYVPTEASTCQFDFCAGVVCPNNATCEITTGDCSCDAGYVDNGGTCELDLPQTCANHRSGGAVSDGFYEVYHQGDPLKPWMVWCADMFMPTPQDYLPLAMTHEDHNVFERFGEPGMTGMPAMAPFDRRLTRTRYEKVRIDPLTLKVNPFDQRFAQTEVIQDVATDLGLRVNPVPFGVVEGCGLQLADVADRDVAQGKVSLEGTPFFMADNWVSAGVCSQSTAQASGGALLDLVGDGGASTGGCGAMVPSGLADQFASGCMPPAPPVSPGMLTDPFVVAMQYAAPVAGFLPKACDEAKLLGTCVNDGACTLYVARNMSKDWQANCINMMTSSPATYFDVRQSRPGSTYPNGTADHSSINSNGSHISGSTYDYVLINGHTLLVDITDRQFAILERGSMHNDVGVSQSCDTSQQGASQLFLELLTRLHIASPFEVFGECQTGSSGTSSATGQFLLSRGGSHINEQGMAVVGCGGIAPAPYARQRGYQSCDASDDMQPGDVAPRPSSEQKYLLELRHVDGNP